VWRDVGPARDRLYISRLWGNNEAQRVEAELQIIVATIQKLTFRVNDPQYVWLREAEFVVVDEAHGATEPSYTAAINWVVKDGRNDRCPLLGLTATPFRGGEDETKRLVSRFGGKRLDHGILGDDPYRELEEMKVLAKVQQRELPGVDLELDRDELDTLRKLSRLPSSAERRLGAHVRRNEILLDDIKKLEEDWPVLLFATSVDHAKTMAALLRVEGVSAAAISADTDMGARRHYIEEFRKGRLRVLTNYGVLTAGFDAPSVRALYVARPTYSPVLYQQMIGRGLRGPLNGGKPFCLIVNVEDNILRYGEELAFKQFEYLWRGSEGS
jgi:superfamily II DNA or RNA helicase